MVHIFCSLKRLGVAGLLLAVVLCACGPEPIATGPSPTEAVMAPTDTSLAPTETPRATDTPEPTATLSPTPGPMPTNTPKPTPTATTSPAQATLESALAAQAEANSYHFDIDLQMVVSIADSTTEVLFTFSGDRQRPDRMQGIVSAESEGIRAESRSIIVGRDGYQTDPVTGKWQPISGPIFLFSPEDVLGLDPVDVEDLQVVGDEIVEARSVHHLRGTVPPRALSSLGTDVAGELRADFWIDVADHAIRRVTLEGEMSGLYTPGDSTHMVTTVSFSNYGQTVAIELSSIENADMSPPPAGCLVLSSDRDGDWDIYALNMADADEENGEDALVRLTDLPGEEHGASWSPDDSRIVFWSEHARNRDIYVLDVSDAFRGASEEGPMRMTDHPGLDTDPHWSPDGSRIGFSSDRDGNEEIYIMDIEAVQSGAGTSALTRFTINPARDVAPVWSPDGALIAFESDRTGNLDIYVASPDGGSSAKPLTRDSAHDANPVWSPDGRYIAYQSGREWHEDIYIVDVSVALENPDESAVIQLTSDEGGNRLPVWSPDGAWLAYVTESGAGLEIRAINLDEALEDPAGAQKLLLARGLLYVQSAPAWSPGGSHIAVVAMLGWEAVRSLQVVYVEPALEAAGRAQPVPLTAVTSFWMTPVKLSWSPQPCDG